MLTVGLFHVFKGCSLLLFPKQLFFKALVQEKGKADLKCSFLFSGEWEWQGGREKERLVLVTMALMKV